jgi:hypothetical protein
MMLTTSTWAEAERFMTDRCGAEGYSVDESESVPMGYRPFGRGKMALPPDERVDTRVRFHCK